LAFSFCGLIISIRIIAVPVQFWQKIEIAASPLIAELRQRLAAVPTLALLNHYQLQHHLSQFNKEKFPDGFWAKWRYLWALKLSTPFLGAIASGKKEQEFERIDELVEKIFDAYSFGAIYEPGRTPGSEKEFLSRLGLGLGTREPDTLGFPEQFKSWATARLKPFDETYFLPTFGLRFEEIYGWLDRLIAATEARLNSWVGDMVPIFNDLKSIQSGFVDGTLTPQECRRRAQELKIYERLEKNAQDSDTLHVLSGTDIRSGLPRASLEALTALLAIRPGDVGAEFNFPHDASPLEWKSFVTLPDETFYFIDPASAHRIFGRTFERALLDDWKLRERYLASRSRAVEDLVAQSAGKLFPKENIHRNYYLEKGSLEKDLLILSDRVVVLIESKNSRVRAFRGATDDLIKFESDFENSVQYGYEQANEVKRRILENEETTFLDDRGRPKFSLKRSEFDKVYILCVSVTPRGPFGTDLSYQLKKEVGEPFPLALGLFDFETICKHFDRQQFVKYLEERERLHGHVTTGDELNYAGYFLRFGHLNFEAKTFVADDFSGIFDRRWYRERGFEVEEPSEGPILTSMIRKGNRVSIDSNSGQRERINLPEWVIERTVGKSPIRMKGSERNQPCPCKSGLKLKRCCGIS
jgi:SEC-C motif